MESLFEDALPLPPWLKVARGEEMLAGMTYM